MKSKKFAFTLMIIILSFAISSPVYAQKIQLDFKPPLHNSMNCKNNSNGTLCIEFKPNFSGKTISRKTRSAKIRKLTPIAKDVKSPGNLSATNSVVPQNAVSVDAGWEMTCLSGGGSAAATGKAGGFCLASDMNSPATDFVNFSVANGLPATGLQFLQVTLRDGSTFVRSRELTDDGSISAECVSAGGSTASTKSGKGFCLAADLAIAIPAAVAVANGLPIAGVHFLQVTFSANSQLSVLPLVEKNAPIETKCVSVDGSTATTGNVGGFCLVSDLSISIIGDANFSVANELPVTSMHFLQVTFGDTNVFDELHPDTYSQPGTECVSVAGSSANTGGNGVSCLASDLYSSTTGTASLSFANDLPIVGMQFLQTTFGDSGQAGELHHLQGDGAPALRKCVSDDGSMAVTGNTEGFCLVSDRSTSMIGFANLAFANGLPVASLHFLQIPPRSSSLLSRLGHLLGRFSYLLGKKLPMGVVISDSARTYFDRSSLPDLAGIAGYHNHYFRISQRRSGIEVQLSPDQRRHLRPVFVTSH